jgi:hypothetical protein
MRLGESRLRLFRDEASNIGSELIAMTPLQQQNRVHRSAKKAVAHQGKDDLAQGTVADAPVEGVKPCIVERGDRASGLPKPGFSRRELAYFAVVR